MWESWTQENRSVSSYSYAKEEIIVFTKLCGDVYEAPWPLPKAILWTYAKTETNLNCVIDCRRKRGNDNTRRKQKKQFYGFIKDI